MPLDETAALKILEQVSQGPASEAKFNAEVTIEEWRNGRLDVDWFVKRGEALTSDEDIV